MSNIAANAHGTVVEHQYPAIGRYTPGCKEVIEKLLKAGHHILLNTLRCELNTATLVSAVSWFNDDVGKKIGNYEINPTEFKVHPGKWDLESFKSSGEIIIDDASVDVPLIPATYSAGSMVDWKEIDRQLEEAGFYEEVKT